MPSSEQFRSRRRARGSDYKPSDPLLNARQAAHERGQGLSTFWRDVKRGRAPQPFYVSPRSPRWRLSEIVASVDASRSVTAARFAAPVTSRVRS